MFTGKFFKATAERAVRTFAQALAATLGAGAVNILDVPWTDALAVSAGAAVLSILTSVAAGAVTSTPGPSLTDAEVTTPESPAEPSPLS
jgi:hypothetical protein